MPSSPKQPSIHALAAGGMIAMAAAMGIGRFVYTPVLPSMMEQLGLSASQAGLIASANYLGYLVGAWGAGGGWAAGHERFIAILALVANAALLGAMAFDGGLGHFLLVRFGAGVASAFVMIFASTIVFGRLAREGRNDLQWMHFSGVGVGISLSSVLVGFVWISGWPWPAGWAMATVLAIAAALAVALLLPPTPPSASSAAREPPLVRTAALVRIIAAYGVFGFGYIITATFIVAIVRASEAGGLAEPAVWLAAGLAGIPSIWLWGKFARRFGIVAAFVTGCLVEAVGVGASVTIPGLAGPFIGAILLGGTFIAVTAFGLQAGRILAAASPRTALALMTVSFGTGQILGPLFAGYVADLTGSFLLPSFGGVAALLLAAGIARPVRLP